ncbi:MAG: hypothetical protein R3F35_11710 [Myxococcota bacterium]
MPVDGSAALIGLWPKGGSCGLAAIGLLSPDLYSADSQVIRVSVMRQDSAVHYRPTTAFLIVVGVACTIDKGVQETGPALDRSLISMCENAADNHDQSIALPDYWEPKTFDSDGFLDSLTQEWFGTQLCALGESPLREFTNKATIRLLWLRSFHPGVAVRVFESRNELVLVAKILTGAGGYAPGRVAREVRHPISREEWNSIIDALNSSQFWSLPTSKDENSMDGSKWVVEAAIDKRYHVVDRQSGDEIRSIGELLLNLSTLNPEPIY